MKTYFSKNDKVAANLLILVGSKLGCVNKS